MSLEMYRAQILEHYKNPRHKGRIENADAHHKESNPLCADEIEVFLKIKEGVVEDIKFDGQGCAISLASADLLAEFVKGKRLEEVKSLTKENVFELLGVAPSPARMGCALLALNALKSACVCVGK